MEAAGPPGRSLLIGRAFAGGVGVLPADSEAGDTGAPRGQRTRLRLAEPRFGALPDWSAWRDIVRGGGNPEPGRGGGLGLRA